MDGGRRGERGGGWRWSPRSSAYGDGRRLEVPARAALSGKGRGRSSTVSTQPCGDLATSSIKGVAYGGLLCHFHGNSASDGRGRVNRRRRRCAQPSAAAPGAGLVSPGGPRQCPCCFRVSSVSCRVGRIALAMDGASVAYRVCCQCFLMLEQVCKSPQRRLPSV